jgi:hypothetical protein
MTDQEIAMLAPAFARYLAHFRDAFFAAADGRAF